MTGFAQHGSGIDVQLSDRQSLRAEYLVGAADRTEAAARALQIGLIPDTAPPAGP